MIKYRSQLGELMQTLNLPGETAEVGVAEGRFSLEIINWNIPKLYLIDRWTSNPYQKGDGGFPQEWHNNNLFDCKERLIKFKDKVVFLQGDSSEMASNILDNTLSLVYLDADHSYDAVKKDIISWYPKLIRGGIFAFHDYLSPAYGVKQAVEEFCQDKIDIVIIPEESEDNTGAYFIKE